MTNKLFTPLKIGDLDLEHRIVLEWPHAIDPLDVAETSPARPLDPKISGGLAIFDPGPFIQAGRRPQTLNGSQPMDSVWRSVVHNAKMSRQSTLARLRGDLSFQIPDQLQGIGALTQRDIEKIIGDYVEAAQRAKSNGFDGIELDGSFGSITDLFLMPSTNLRSDRYGGPIVKRVHFLTELVEALAPAFGRDRVGVRLSPFLRGMAESVRHNVYDEVLRSLHDQEIAYVHIELTERGGIQVLNSSPFAKALRQAYPGIFITSGQQGLDLAMDIVESRWADAACFLGPQIDSKFLDRLRRAGPEDSDQ
jgi:2,4-dienoyl-CoA reductase-like NADH-dependent reductase (Old Yellow Enzyme family)